MQCLELWFRLPKTSFADQRGQNGYFKGHIFTRNNYREELVWPCSDPLSLFVREGINEQIWTKYARTKKILILHLRVAQLVPLVQKSWKVMAEEKSCSREKITNADDGSFFSNFQFHVKWLWVGTHFKNCLWAKNVFSWGQILIGDHPWVTRHLHDAFYILKPKFC